MACSTNYGNEGCNGGLMDNAFRYIEAYHGLDIKECYPYQAHNEICHFSSSCIGATLTRHRDVVHRSEMSLQSATQSVGPISVAIDMSHTFQLYRDDIYNEPEYSSTQLDHGVLVVGYETEEGENYWLVKNSWAGAWMDTS